MVNIVLRTPAKNYMCHVTIHRQPRRDGVCQHCGKTRLVRLATVQVPLGALALMHDPPAAIEPMLAAAVVTGQSHGEICVGLACLSVFFAQFDGIDPALVSAIRSTAQRIERCASRVERVLAFDLATVAKELWDGYRPIFTEMFRPRSASEPIDQDACYRAMDAVERHPWCRAALSKRGQWNIRYRAWSLFRNLASPDYPRTESETFAAFRRVVETQGLKAYDRIHRNYLAAETIVLGV